MFYGTREGVLEVLSTLGTQQCQYSRDTWATFCDCKFGLPKAGSTGEHTGCPELRTLHALISVMTDAEWARYCGRATRLEGPGDCPDGCVTPEQW